jgi:hypothetical protein
MTQQGDPDLTMVEHKAGGIDIVLLRVCIGDEAEGDAHHEDSMSCKNTPPSGIAAVAFGTELQDAVLW